MFIFLQKVLIIDLNSFTVSENKHLQHAVIFMLPWIIVIGLGRAKALLLRSSNSCIIGVPKILKFRGAENLRKVLFPAWMLLDPFRAQKLPLCIPSPDLNLYVERIAVNVYEPNAQRRFEIFQQFLALSCACVV